MQPNSFEDSLEDSSLQEDSLARASLQRTALTPELAQLQRRTSTTELAKLERRTLTLELAERDSTALHTELEQLDEPALKKAAFSLELRTAHFAEASLAPFCGPRFFTSGAQGGVLDGQLAITSLTLTSLSFRTLAAQACLELSEKRASPLQA